MEFRVPFILTQSLGHIYFGNCTRILVQFVPKYWRTSFTPHLLCILVFEHFCDVLDKGFGFAEMGVSLHKWAWLNVHHLASKIC